MLLSQFECFQRRFLRRFKLRDHKIGVCNGSLGIINISWGNALVGPAINQNTVLAIVIEQNRGRASSGMLIFGNVARVDMIFA